MMPRMRRGQRASELGARVTHLEAPDRDHFDIVEALSQPDAPVTVAVAALCKTVAAAPSLR